MCPESGIRYTAWNRCLHPQGESDEGNQQGAVSRAKGAKVQQYSHGILFNREGRNPGQAVVELVISVVALTVTDFGNKETEDGGAMTDFEVTGISFEVELTEDIVMLTDDGVTIMEALLLVRFTVELKAMAWWQNKFQQFTDFIQHLFPVSSTSFRL